MQETRVPSLGWEDPLEEEMATYSSILVWRIPWTEETGSQQSMGLQKVRHHRATEYLYLAKYLSQNLSSKGGHYDCNIIISILLINCYYELFVVIIISFPRIMVMAMPMAKKKTQQLPESTLPTPSLLGGSPGSVIR